MDVRLMSLACVNEHQDIDADYRAYSEDSWAAARVSAALLASSHSDRWPAFYDGYGHRRHVEGLRDSILDRAQAYLAAGADCMFVPGLVESSHIQTLVNEIGRGRLSLLVLPGLPAVPELERLGVARVSHGPALHRATAAFISAWP